MAGVPQVFQAMINNVLPTLRTGAVMLSRSVTSPFGEGDIGTALAAVQKAHPETSIGSYPRFDGKAFTTELVIRARSEDVLDAAEQAVKDMLALIRADRAKPDLG
jgi:molybdopterin-biosynthesis enzyme MoeA-like protein